MGPGMSPLPGAFREGIIFANVELSVCVCACVCVCTCVHLSMIHSEGCFSLHKIFMLVVHGSIIAISGLELFIGCTVHIVSFTDREDNTIREDPKHSEPCYFALSSGIILL